ncbi:DUF6000 family protein [Thalassomonas haliotis]|uniref:Uncharacterized protein n=1 Tax=Thalassomonas haliotis TaxID=485448 RepID=A0ABY7VBF8_9GAMM|nr:DUF6000 family protein [Thalassomonas haliotis]WDE10641.1 hypothetical protein H3N35_20635 [Thalassomonas haliotis]
MLKDKTKESLALHVAGATIGHKGQFSNLQVIENDGPLEIEFLRQYVSPFYLGDKDTEKFRNAYLDIRKSIDINFISKLLGDFNWRSRSVGAYFTALEDFKEMEVNIGNLLLRSDVCYAGRSYCLALASFSTPLAIDFLNQYLEYYLKKPDLWFDQNSAMSALAYIGESTGEDLVIPHLATWENFIKNKPNWELTSSISHFKAQMKVLTGFKNEISS